MSASPPNQPPGYRAFQSSDIAAAHGLSLAVGWPHRAEDWRRMFDAGSGFAAHDNGRLIGTALFWLSALGLTRVDTVVRMVRNEPAERHTGNPDAIYGVFGILNQAMG